MDAVRDPSRHPDDRSDLTRVGFLGTGREKLPMNRHGSTGARKWQSQRARADSRGRRGAGPSHVPVPSPPRSGAAATVAIPGHRRSARTLGGSGCADPGPGRRGGGRGGRLRGRRFGHLTSRSGDPHLHTHVVVAHPVRYRGRWTALDGRRCFPCAKPVGHLDEAQLRAELTRRLGVEWGPVRNGIAGLAAAPRPFLESGRRGCARRPRCVPRLPLVGGSGRGAPRAVAAGRRPCRRRLSSVASTRSTAGGSAEAAARSPSRTTTPEAVHPMARARRTVRRPSSTSTTSGGAKPASVSQRR